MTDDLDSPDLGVGFAIDFRDSFGQLRSLDDLIGVTQANAVREFQKIEAASKGALNLGGATAEVKAFGNALTREGMNAAREMSRTEKAGEAMVRQLERQNAAFGKSREELRLMKAEAQAVAAEKQGFTELAARIRTTESALASQELAAARRARFAAEELAETRAAEEAARAQKALEDRTRAERLLVLQLGERAQIEAALERNTGLGRPRATDAGATFSALEARAAEQEALAIRQAANAYQLFEAKVREGSAAMREREALTARYAAQAVALRAQIDPTSAAQQHFNQEIAQARTLISAGAISLDEYVAKLRLERNALASANDAQKRAATSTGAHRQAMQGLSFQAQDAFTQISMGTNVLSVLAIQGGQAAGQLANLEGKLGAAANFMLGPWGLAITAGMLVLGTFGDKLLKQNNALDDSIKKLKQDAAESDVARRAKEAFSRTIEGHIELQRTLNDELERGLKTQQQLDAAQLGAARRSLRDLEIDREKVMADVLKQQQLLQTASGNVGLAGAAPKFDLELRESIQKLAAINKGIATARESIRLAEIPIIERRIDGALDASVAATNRYTDELGRLRLARQNDQISAAAFERQELAARRTRDAAIAKIREQEKAESSLANTRKDLAQFGSPLPGARVTSGYGQRDRPTAGASSNHLAIDYAATLGQPILAAADGIVKFADAVKGYGNRIELAHGASTKSTYSHLSGFNVRDGQAVNKGDVIGYAGRTGTATGVHLHYEVLVNGKKVDPTKGQFPIDGTFVAEQAAHAQEALQQFGDRSAESVARLTEQFNEQPRLLDQAARSTRQLDDIIADLQKRQPPGFEKTITEAQAAKIAIEQSLLRPFQEMEEAAKRRGQIAILTAEGFGTEATVLQTIWQLEERLGDLTPERAAKVRQIVQDEAKQLANAQAIAAIRGADEDVARLGMELQLIGQTNEARAVALAQFEAMAIVRQNPDMSPEEAKALVAAFVDRAKAQQLVNTETQAYNDALTLTADKWDIIAGKVQSAGQGMADAFGDAGAAIGDLASIYANYQASRERAEVEHAEAIRKAGTSEKLLAQENERFALRSSGAQIEAFGDMASAAQGFFKEGSAGYKALAAAEKVYRIAQMAMSLQSMVQNTLETTATVANAGVRATAEGTAGIASQAKLPFPFNIAAMAATGAALVAAGVMVFGGGSGGANPLPKSNQGTGTVLGDNDAKSESIRRGLDALADIDTVMLGHSREMAASLKSIESQVGGFAALVLRTGGVNASAGVNEGFKANAIGSTLGGIPVIGGLLKGLFGTKTKVVGSGLFGEAQSLDEILGGGFDASYYSDVQKKKKLFGFTTSTKYSTSFAEADSGLENQFTLILREFNTAIMAAAGPLGESTEAIERKLNGFVVDIGKIDLQGLTGEEIQEKLSTVFGSAADKMATAAFPGVEKFQRVGEGLFETLVRVSSTMESVTASLGLLGTSASALDIDAKMGLAGQFESVGAFTSAIDGYFDAFYSEQEKVAARAAQMDQAFAGLGVSTPASIAAFRSLVEAQDLTASSGQATYATLLQLAPAFADLQSALGGTEFAARSTADILRERQDIERRILEVQGDTAALKALDLAAFHESNRALQEHYLALTEVAAATQAAAEIEKARVSLRIEILEAQGRAEEALALRQQQRIDATDPLLRAELDQLFAAQKATKAAQELAAAQDTAVLAMGRMQQLQLRLYQAQGNTAAATNLQNEIELAGAQTEAERKLIAQIQAAQAAAERRAADQQRAEEARQKAEDIARQTTGFQVDILRSLGKEEAAVAKEREAALKAMDPALRKWQQAAWYVADTAGKLTGTIDTFGRLGDTLRDYRDGLYAADQATGASYRQLQVDFLKTAALAQAGDETALGKLTGVGSAFLDGARANATSEIQLARDMALVARSIDGAIGATDDAIDYAKDQLSALELLVTGQATTNITLADIRNSAPIAVPSKGAESLGDAVVRMNAASSKSDEKFDKLLKASEDTAREVGGINYKLSRVVGNDAIKTREQA